MSKQQHDWHEEEAYSQQHNPYEVPYPYPSYTDEEAMYHPEVQLFFPPFFFPPFFFPPFPFHPPFFRRPFPPFRRW